MTNEQLKVFEEIVAECLAGRYASINVGSEKRSWAIVAVYEQVNELTTQVAELRGALQAALLPLEAAENILTSPNAWRGVGPVVELLEKALAVIREGLE